MRLLDDMTFDGQTGLRRAAGDCNLGAFCRCLCPSAVWARSQQHFLPVLACHGWLCYCCDDEVMPLLTSSHPGRPARPACVRLWDVSGLCGGLKSLPAPERPGTLCPLCLQAGKQCISFMVRGITYLTILRSYHVILITIRKCA